MTTAILDGDVIAYAAAASHQKDIPWDGTNTEPTADLKGAAEAAAQSVVAWTRLANCKDAIVCFTGRDNFRKHILPTYKANRAGRSKPLAYVYVLNSLRNRFDTKCIEGLEGDDVMGIWATSLQYDGPVMMTIDKDLRTVPGRHMNPHKQTKPDTVAVAEATYAWMLQALHGDATDGYSGIPKIGPKKAAAILGAQSGHTPPEMWSRVVSAYAAAGLSEDEALVQARVSRILCSQDYDAGTREVILWHPTKPERLPLETIRGAPRSLPAASKSRGSTPIGKSPRGARGPKTSAESQTKLSE